jgi:glycosyltransferase involved in cell wall biosynthesis
MISASGNHRKLIVHVIDSLGLGGAEKLLINTITVLPDYDHVICLLTNVNKFNTDAFLQVKEVISLGGSSNAQLFGAVLKLRRVIRKYRPALVHAHLLKSTWVARMAVNKHIPLFFTVHNVLSEDAFKVNRSSYFLEKWSYRKNQFLIGVSREVLRDYDEWIGIKGRSEVVYNLIDPCFFENAIPPDREHIDGKTRLVAVGNLRRQKNYPNLLRAMEALKGRNVSLDIYGEGTLKGALQNLIDASGLNVRLMGRSDKIHELLPAYDGYVMASSFEGYGIAVVEAMASGLPVILSDLPVLREVSGGKGLFFNPEAPDDIILAIRSFLEIAPEEKKAMAEESKIRAHQIASPQGFRDQILQIYGAIIN